MTIPGLALFYGGLAAPRTCCRCWCRSRDLCLHQRAVGAVWLQPGIYRRRPVLRRLDKLFLKGIAPDTSQPAAHHSEYVFVAFQSTFAAITVALIVGSFAERVRFSAVLIFSVLWFTFQLHPHGPYMVWGGGLLAKDGALDFCRGTGGAHQRRYGRTGGRLPGGQAHRLTARKP